MSIDIAPTFRCEGCREVLTEADRKACHRCRMATLQADPEVERELLRKISDFQIGGRG